MLRENEGVSELQHGYVSTVTCAFRNKYIYSLLHDHIDEILHPKQCAIKLFSRMIGII